MRKATLDNFLIRDCFGSITDTFVVEIIYDSNNEIVSVSEAQDYITNLNIAQTKRKCGIIERQNYNLPKSEDSVQPETTAEKEAAIKEAFRHFHMI